MASVDLFTSMQLAVGSLYMSRHGASVTGVLWRHNDQAPHEP